MNKLSAKAKTIGMILLAALLLAVPLGIVSAEIQDNPSNAADGVEPLGPGELELGELPAVGPREPVVRPPCHPAHTTPLPRLEVVTPHQPVGPPWPTEDHQAVKGITTETLQVVATTCPDTGERIYIESRVVTGLCPPRKVGGNVHGSALTHAEAVSGVSTEVVVSVALWWWDAPAARWRQRALASDSDTSVWLGWYRAEAIPTAVGESGIWAATSVHRVYRDGARYYYTHRESAHVELTFP